jgi:hypothetical protein
VKVTMTAMAMRRDLVRSGGEGSAGEADGGRAFSSLGTWGSGGMGQTRVEIVSVDTGGVDILSSKDVPLCRVSGSWAVARGWSLSMTPPASSMVVASGAVACAGGSVATPDPSASEAVKRTSASLWDMGTDWGAVYRGE